ncbi:MFS transporter [Gimibacter soli]|uniref:MFS transporter n=1 Tax=Gimibacter soli TaxID=3024400 RepID=A0AAE9XQY2_9PROT|nr:MFS transporter [Gimibacter soli]WCL53481.1 MFS transporter [Gimibacter soli]
MTKLSLREKVGYALGDVASNFYWRIFDLFLLIFYTDVFGLPAAAVGTMMLVARIIDALTDPLMGGLADRTRSRFGKFRPYLLWGIVPLVFAGVLTFTTPDLDVDGKLLWAYATYVFMMLSYTFINVPYGALIGVMTSDSHDRTVLTSFRFIGAFTGGSIVAYLTPELVALLGQGDEVRGWQMTMALYGLVAALLFLITFLSVRERVSPISREQASLWVDIKDLGRNKPWLVLFSLALVIMITITLRASTGTFYLKYYVDRPDLIGAFSMTYMLALMMGAAITPLLTKFMGKKQLMLILMCAVTILSAAFYFIPRDQVLLMFVMQALIGICLGPKSPLVFSMYADTADYSEWHTGRRATAMVFAAAAFSQKLGGALAAALIGWLLGALGYAANQVQTSTSEAGIVMLMTIIPAVFAGLSVLLVRIYPLDEQSVETINLDLASQRAVIGKE